MSKLNERLAALATMSPAQLREEWTRLHKAPCPRFSPDLLRLSVAYRLQAVTYGDHSTSTLRQLRAGSSKPATPRLKPGSRLMRTWNGRTIGVMVEDGGFLFEGRQYSSLSAIAREVTGTAWSGPRFFGLTEASRGKAA